jgi:hypothetical protein
MGFLHIYADHNSLMPQWLSSYGLASAKDYAAIIYGGVPGVEK